MEQLNLDIPTTISNSDTFGCCHLYRACSDARHCVSERVPDSPLCQYNYNLKAGRIFYGKNANGYSAERYVEFLGIYNRLSEEAKSALNEYIVNFHIRVYRDFVINYGFETVGELCNSDLISLASVQRIFNDKKGTTSEGSPAYTVLLSDVKQIYPKFSQKDGKGNFREWLPAEIIKGNPKYPEKSLRERYNALAFNRVYDRYFTELFYDNNLSSLYNSKM